MLLPCRIATFIFSSTTGYLYSRLNHYIFQENSLFLYSYAKAETSRTRSKNSDCTAKRHAKDMLHSMTYLLPASLSDSQTDKICHESVPVLPFSNREKSGTKYNSHHFRTWKHGYCRQTEYLLLQFFKSFQCYILQSALYNCNILPHFILFG